MRKNLSADEEPEEKKPSGPVFLRLSVPVNGLIAGRIVTASATRARALKKDGQAKSATPKQVAMAGGNIPHIHD